MSNTIVDAISNSLPEKVRSGSGPGCAVAVLHKGEVVERFCIGLASIEHHAPIRSSTAFRIASLSKQFLSAAAVLENRQGRLDLDAPLNEYLDGLKGVPATATLRQCLQNTSGIPDHLELLSRVGGGLQLPHTVEEAYKLICQQTVTNFEPGSSYLYSNANFLLLTLIVEQTSGQPLSSLLEKTFFQPLGMVNTRLVPGHRDIIENLATPYVATKNGCFERAKMETELTGEGGMISTIEDMALWLDYYRRDPDNIIAELARPAVFTSGKSGRYGLGLISDTYRGTREISHNGLWPGYRSEIVWFPEPDIGVICMANVNTIAPYEVNRAAAMAVTGNSFSAPPAAEIETSLKQAAIDGSPYVDPQSLEYLEITDDEDGFSAVLHGSIAKLIPAASDRANFAGNMGEFVSVDVSAVADGTLNLRGINGSDLKLTSTATLGPTPLELQSYAGNYRNETDGAHLTISTSRDGLQAQVSGHYRNSEIWTVKVYNGDLAVMDENTGPWPKRVVLQFDRDEAGAIVGLRANGPRVKRKRYEKVPGQPLH